MKNIYSMFMVNMRTLFVIDKTKNKFSEIMRVGAWAIITLIFSVLIAFGMYAMSGVVGVDGAVYLLSTLMFAVQMYVLFFGTAQYVSVLFMSKDNEFLMALPVKPHEIFIAKLTAVYATFLAVSLGLMLPSVIAIGFGLRISNFAFYILGILGSLVVPILPLLIISIIAFPISYLVNYFRRSSVLATILYGVIFVGLFAGYMYLIYYVQNDGMVADIASMINTLKILSMIIYPNIFLSTAMLTSGGAVWLNLLYYLLIVLSVGAVAIIFSMFMYSKCATRFLEVGSPAKSKKGKNTARKTMQALVIRDIKCTFSSGVQSLNYVIMLLMTPIVIFMTAMGKESAEGADELMSLIGASMVFLLICGINYLSIIGFSREGKNFVLLKTLPVSAKQVIKSKLLIADIYTLVGSIIGGVTLIATNASALMIILTIFTSFVLGIGINGCTLERDLKKPKLDWQNMRVLMKNNMSSLFGMLMVMPAFIWVIGYMFLVGLVPALVEISESIRTLIFVAPVLLLGIIYCVFFRVLNVKKCEKLFEEIE